MIRADAEAANDDEVFGLGQDASGELSFGTDAEDIDIPNEEGVSVGSDGGRSGASNTVFSR